MSLTKKVTILLGSIVLLGLISLQINKSFFQTNSQVQINNVNDGSRKPVDNNLQVPELTFGQITRIEAINHVNYFYNDQSEYARNSLESGGEKKYIITFYQPNYRDPGLVEEDRRGGVLVFEIKNDKLELIWESTEKIVLTRPKIELKDITGDGKSEILATWSDGKVSILYIYSWDGKTFKFITPIKKVEFKYEESNIYAPIFGASGDIQITDYDGDGLDDILLISPKIDGGYGTSIYKWSIDKNDFVKIKELETEDVPQI